MKDMILVFVVSKYPILWYCVVGIQSYDFNDALQVNEKGQLRLSHRALLPDTEASPKDGLVEEKTEQSKDKSSTPNVTASSKRSSEDDSVLPSKKFVRRLVSSSQDKPFTNKDKRKKSSNKAVGSVSGEDESSLVSGEA